MNTATASPLAALRHRDFRLLFFGLLISITGSQMRIVAINWQIYQIAQRTPGVDPALALGTIGLVRMIALLVSAPLSGVIADHYDRRQIVVVTSLVALLSSALLAVASTGDDSSLALIYGLTLLTAIAAAFELPARQALVPNLVPAAELPNALSLNVIAWQIATIVGPSLGGVLLATAGVVPLYWIDAVSFLAITIAAILMRSGQRHTSAPRFTFAAAFEGLRFVFRSPMIASTMLLDFFATFFGAATTLLPLFAAEILQVGPLELGWLYAAPSVGAVMAASMLTSTRLRHQGALLLWAVVIFGICTAIFGLSSSLWLTLLALAGTGAADTMSMVIRSSIRQLMTPDELRGRMGAVNMVFFAGGPQLGEFQSGVLAALIGAPLTVFVGGLAVVVTSGLVAWRVPALRRYDHPERVSRDG